MDENTKAELYKMYARAMKMMPGSSQQKELVKKIGALRKKLGMNEERDYKAEYKKFQSSTKSKKYRAELNKYNRKKGTYGNGDGKDASHKGGKIVGFESQSKNRGRAEKSRLKKESLIYEIPSSVFSAAAAVKLKNKDGKEVSAATAVKSDYAKKDPATHKKAKSIFQRLKDKFSKKKDAKPKKQSKSDADFYKRQYAGESVNEGKFSTEMVNQAVGIAFHYRDNMTKAVKAIEKMKKGLSKDKEVAYALRTANESVNEGQKRQASDIINKFDKAYLNFGKEVRDVIKMVNRSTGEKTDGKIIDKAYSKHLIPLDKLMQSWSRGQQDNPHIKESDLGLTYKKGKTVKVKHKTSGKRLVVVDKPSVRKEYEKIGYFAESINEAEIRWGAVDNAIIKYIKHNVKVLEKPIKAKDEELTKKYLKGFIDGLVNAQRSLKLESVNEAKSKTMKTIGSIIGKKQAQKISGVLVDMQTALVIMKVWNALGSSNRAKFEKLPIKKMATVAWKLMK